MAAYEEEPNYRQMPSIMTTTSFVDALRPWSNDEIRPFLSKGSPFQGWSPPEIHRFFVEVCDPIKIEQSTSTSDANVKPQKFDPWTSTTFVVIDSDSTLDKSSPYYRTVLLCSDKPDFEEYQTRFLKSTRVRFEDVLVESMLIDDMMRCVSEVGKQTVMSMFPPAVVIGQAGRRQTISFGVRNEAPWSEEHLRRQPSQTGFERYWTLPESDTNQPRSGGWRPAQPEQDVE